MVKEKGGYTASLEVEEKAAQQHLLLQLNVSEVTSTKRMPPEGEKTSRVSGPAGSLRKTTLQLNSTTGSTGRLPLPPHRRYSSPVKRIIKGAIKRRQISGSWSSNGTGQKGWQSELDC